MCKAISIIMSADSWWGPAHDGWHHAHSTIASGAGLPDGLYGDRYARVEITPPDDKWRNDDGSVRNDVETWPVHLDEDRAPGWWADDETAQVDRARRYAARWLAAHPANFVPGYTAMGGDFCTLNGGDFCTLNGGYGSTLTGGDRSTLTGGYGSTLTGGNRSTLTGGDGSTLTGGDRSTLTGGYGSTLTGGYGSTLTGGDRSTLTGGNRSTLTGGNRSTLTGGDGSTLCWRVWDGSHFRLHVAYVGKQRGIEANKPYEFRGDKIVAAKARTTN